MRFKKQLLSGLLLCWSCSALWAQSFEVKQFVVRDQVVLSADEAADILEPFLGDHAGLDGLYAAKDALEQALADKGLSFYRAVLPTQTLKDGIVYFELVEFKLADIEVTGNEHFSSANILSGVPVAKAESPNIDKVTAALRVLNDNPSRSVKLNFKAGDERDTLKAIFEVEDQDPQSFYTQINNYGGDPNSRFRLALGYQHNNLFDRAHALTTTYTLSPEDLDELKQFGINYRIPIVSYPSFINLLYSKSTVNSVVESSTVFGVQQFNVVGDGEVLGISFEKPLANHGNFAHGVTLGVNHKKLDNTSALVNIHPRPLQLGYSGRYRTPAHNLFFSLQLSSNLEGGANNTASDYRNYGLGSSRYAADWSKLGFNLSYIYPFSGQLLSLNWAGQWSDDALISGEHFGLGGVQSVRAYEDHVIAGERAQQLRVEYWSTPFTAQKLRWVGFFDAGEVARSSTPLPQSSINGYGLGLRWNEAGRASVSADLAVAGESAGVTQRGDNRFYLSLFYRF